MPYVVITNENFSMKNDIIELELDKIATVRLCECFYTSIIFLAYIRDQQNDELILIFLLFNHLQERDSNFYLEIGRD